MKINWSTKRSYKYALILLILQMNLVFIFSDLPVHCKREEIEGNWTFRIENETFDTSLTNPKTNCGHGFPDRIEKDVGDTNFKFESYKDIEVVLGADYKIYDGKNSKKVVGTWTPVYDEAFVAYYKNSVFTAFMKYYLKDESSNKNYSSNCDKTMIGWYIQDSNQKDKNWSCFFGFKSNVRSEFSPNRFLQVENKKSRNRNVINNSSSNFIEMSLSAKTQAALGLHMMKYDQKELVKEINSMNLSWKADIHEEFKGLSFFQLKEKLGMRKEASQFHRNRRENSYDPFDYANQPPSAESASFSDLDNVNSNSYNGPLDINEITKKNSNDDVNFSSNEAIGNFPSLNGDPFENKKNENNEDIIEDFSSRMKKGSQEGSSKHNRKTKVEQEEDSYNVNDPSIMQKYLHKELNEIDVDALPKNWDWRNVGGVNYVNPPRRQQNCGSCYVFSLMASLESRLRILTNNKDQTELSRQFPLACSFYTEGCQGGYPFLVAKFLHEFEVLPESCAPYNPNDVQCAGFCDYSKNPIKYFISKYEYLGGFYGATNEIDLIKEIRARGPIPGNMSVPWTFSYYKNGIFSENSLKKNSGKFSKTTLFDKNLSWSNVDHSILLVGYGEENGIKFWIGLNTWGTQWGEGGYFRILRGENDCNIETMGDAARISFKPRF